MYSIILTIHVIVCLLVVLIVLIQAGRSGGFSGLMGGGGDAIFSTSSQQSGLRKATVILASMFMATSLFLTILSSRQTGQSVFQRQFPNLPAIPAPAQDAVPVTAPVELPAADTTKK